MGGAWGSKGNEVTCKAFYLILDPFMFTYYYYYSFGWRARALHRSGSPVLFLGCSWSEKRLGGHAWYSHACLVFPHVTHCIRRGTARRAQ